MGASMYHPSAFVPVSFTRSIAPAALKSAMEEVAATYRLSSGACRTVIESGKFCRIEGSQFSGSSRVYAEKDKNLYYLVLVFDEAKDVAAMQSVLALLSEYSGQEIMSYAREQYLKEHCTVLLDKDALKRLAGASGK